MKKRASSKVKRRTGKSGPPNALVAIAKAKRMTPLEVYQELMKTNLKRPIRERRKGGAR